jgi:hypothetical protein
VKLPADTITNEQIRELLDECRRTDDWRGGGLDVEDALWLPLDDPRRALARARCAEILNARKGSP